jgi:polyphosphate kinase
VKTSTEATAVARQEPVALTDPSLYINQELSWLAFNERVLEEAEDPSHPLLERIKFLAIVSTNTDEFFMIRVAGLKQALAMGIGPRGDDGLAPSAALAAINRRVHELSQRQRRCLYDELLPALARQGIHVLDYDQLDADQRAALADFYEREIFPVLTPLAVDSGHPFPHISNLSLSLLVVIHEAGGTRLARVKVPGVLPRLVPVEPGPAQAGAVEGGHRPACFVWLEQVVAANIQSLFPGKEIVATYPFRVTRNADMEIQEDEAADLLASVEASLRQRPFGFVSRLTVTSAMPDDCRVWLAEQLEVNPDDIYVLDGPLGLGALMELHKVDRPDLKDPPFTPRVPPALSDGEDLFSVLRRQDVLLHHPYDSFTPVIDLIKTASTDPHVLAIKQTLYRVGQNSPIVEALQEARDDDTQVAVLVELKARFDEENNIGWARALESHGVHVAYGLPGLKTHCKLALIVRRDRDGVRRYVHLGTGNYNAATARVYTDLGLLTSRPEIGADASEVFNYLTGYSEKRDYRRLLVAPVTLRERLAALIEREAAHARNGKPARLIFKMNQLVDGPMIQQLYRAAQAGVRIDLLVRGICCLRPGVPGVSETIRVISIVGRFLEHSRIFYFYNGGDEEVYLGSADLMPRNLDRRVEVVFPIQDPALRAQVRDGILEVQLRDTVKARELQPDGRYVRVRPAPGEAPLDSQAWFLAHPTGTRYQPPAGRR